MTPILTSALGSPGIDRFSPSQLLRTSRLFASDPDLANLLDPDSDPRQRVQLGESRSFGPNHSHHVANVGLLTALSVHLHAPRLTTMTQYGETPAGLQVNGVDRVGVNW